ncbi:MAG: inorganic pyrophosphatase [Planctomycetota bacterium]
MTTTQPTRAGSESFAPLFARPHPWHGLSPGPNPPTVVQVYIEMTPLDRVKYEIDKEVGYLRVDRPQGTSSLLPTLYGFIPRTYCSRKVAACTPHATEGDLDPLDVCVLSDRPIDRAEILLDAKVVGGLNTVDHGRADEKIIAILKNDPVLGHVEDLDDLPTDIIYRLEHYFSTYKKPSPREASPLKVVGMMNAELSRKVVAAAIEDYLDEFGEVHWPTLL